MLFFFSFSSNERIYGQRIAKDDGKSNSQKGFVFHLNSRKWCHLMKNQLIKNKQVGLKWPDFSMQTTGILCKQGVF